MNNRQKANALAVVLIAALAGIAIWLMAGTRQPTEIALSLPLKPLATWTNDLVLTDQELPEGWRYNDGTMYERLGGVSGRAFVFYNTGVGRNATGPSLSEQFGLYPTPLAASQVYTSWVDKYVLPNSKIRWSVPPELDIPLHADQLNIACDQDSFHGVPFRGCSIIARYQNGIFLLYGNVYEDHWLTMADFRSTLEAADRRIANVLSQQK